MWNVAAICALVTIAAAIIRADIPADDGSEYARQMSLWFGFVAMAALDALTIFLIRWHGKCIRHLTNPLTIVLSLSILNHAYGAFLYASRQSEMLAGYDLFINVIAAMQAGVFLWWWRGRKHGRRDRRFHPRTPSINLRNSSMPLRHNQRMAGGK